MHRSAKLVDRLFALLEVEVISPEIDLYRLGRFVDFGHLDEDMEQTRTTRCEALLGREIEHDDRLSGQSRLWDPREDPIQRGKHKNSQGPGMNNQHLPTEIQLHKQSRYLEIAFVDGARFLLPCEYLRVYSPSAEVRGHTPDEAKLQVGKEAVAILDMQQVGSYAVKIFFDDGHKSGLYDWRYLYKLGRGWQALWYDYLDRLAAAGQKRTGPDPFAELQERGLTVVALPGT